MNRYHSLSVFQALLRILGWLLIIAAVAGAVIVLVSPETTEPITRGVPPMGLGFPMAQQVLLALSVLIPGLIWGVLLLAGADLMALFVDLSISSQRTAQLLERQLAATRTAAEASVALAEHEAAEDIAETRPTPTERRQERGREREGAGEPV